ncbi:hypothetical protein GOC91_28675 [Sinorhizobium medicae]|uniref:Uncharacterized protein n=2 Tax=Sinorhizobium medicae TaxID=110321 RepID=A0A508WXY1_9HYPH|nr:hypothetical protein [Sinorhizobium medicae]ABR60281.1 conserved hypothetical signal peptide protein [Sinorhizobium medicae WSM419]MBO1940294.1 hypothetical protein [Sinorhizobium medicae]MBO1962447.1 hypothetical protein [Sinorhizobium medicae]MDX0408535.1 hypothetical protein [Sinorhizobium medicae]MDX0414169.1 hypothetical protein [Sinorhizobium medicae]
MGKFLEFLGGTIVIGTLALLAMTLVPTPDVKTLVAVLPWAFPAIASGLILVAFGAMLGHLAAIRSAADRQADIFQQLLDRRSTAKKE